MCLAMSFDARFDCESFFYSLPDFVKKNRKLLFRLQKKKWTGPDDAHWIAWRSSWGHFRLRSVGVWWSGQGTLGRRAFFFQLFLPFAVIYYDSHHPEKFLRCVSTIIPQRPLSAHLTTELYQKTFNRASWEYFSRKPGFFGRFLFPDSLFFTQLTFVNFWSFAALKQHLLNSDCLWLLRGQKFFLSQILFELRIVALKLRCYLMVVFCLIFRDYTICSLALHEHLVSASVKRLSIFASSVLNTLAPMFRRLERSLFGQGYVKMMSFSSYPWHPSAFHLLKSDFISTCWSDSSKFCINTLKGLRSIIFQTFGLRMFFAVSC